MGRTACTEPQSLYKGALYYSSLFYIVQLYHKICRFVILGAQVTAREQVSGVFVRAFASSFVLCVLSSRASLPSSSYPLPGELAYIDFTVYIPQGSTDP